PYRGRFFAGWRTNVARSGVGQGLWQIFLPRMDNCVYGRTRWQLRTESESDQPHRPITTRGSPVESARVYAERDRNSESGGGMNLTEHCRRRGRETLTFLVSAAGPFRLSVIRTVRHEIRVSLRRLLQYLGVWCASQTIALL